MKALSENNTPLIARHNMACKCGKTIPKGESYTTRDGLPMCLQCALPEPKERRLRLIGIRQAI